MKCACGLFLLLLFGTTPSLNSIMGFNSPVDSCQVNELRKPFSCGTVVKNQAKDCCSTISDSRGSTAQMRVSQKALTPGSAQRDKHSAAKKRYSGCGLSGARQKRDKAPVMGLTKPDIRRLARKAGVKRISTGTYDEAKTALTSFLRTILKDVGVITEGARRMTVTVPDVLLALKRNGRTLYGFGEITSLDQYALSIRKPVKQATLQRAAALVQKRRSQQVPSSPQTAQAGSHPAAAPSAACPRTADEGVECTGQDTAEMDSMRLDSQPDAAQQSTDGLGGSIDMVPATPTASSQTVMAVDEEMREHIQGSVGEYVSKVYKYDPPGSVYKVKDLHSWVVNQYFERKGLESCSPEQLHTVLYALEEENHVMISSNDDDLQIRFVM